MTFPILMIVLGAIALLSIATIVAITIIRKKKQESKKAILLARIAIILLILSCIGLIITTVLVKSASDRGMYDNTQPIDEVMYHIENSPIDQSSEIPAEPTNLLVRVYRFDCKDCNALHETIENDIANYDHINVSSRTPEGKIFSVEYGVNQVPSIVAFNSAGEHLTLPLYTSDENGNPIYLPENTEALIEFASS